MTLAEGNDSHPPAPPGSDPKRPARVNPWLMAALSFAAGLAVALVLDYILYRVGLPSKPFIYVAF